jgi:hypothetical protein
MITPSYGLTAAERVLPRLALNFTTASLDPRITFTRTGNTATVINSSGYVASVNADIPRFDYDPITLACKGLLIEESRINYLTNSEVFSAWPSIVRLGLTSDNTTFPNGATSNTALIPNTENNIHLISSNISTSVSPTANATGTVFFKNKNSSAFPMVYLSGDNATATNGRVAAFFDPITGAYLANGVANGGTFTSADSQALGNGWFRVSVTGIVGSTGTPTGVRLNVGFRTAATGSAPNAFAGNDVDGIYLWGAQLEAGAFPTSYIPTTTTAVTRNADVATMTGTNFSNWYNQTGSTVVCSYVSNNAINTGTLVGYAWTIADGTSASTSSRITVQVRSRTNSISAFYSVTGGGLDASISLLTGSDDGNTAVSFNPGENCAGAANGNATVTAGSAQQAMTATHLFIGTDNESLASVNGTVKNLYYYPQRLTSAELQAFSK